MKAKGIFSALAFALLFTLFASATLWAQATAQIQGTVQDSSGAAVPGAAVKATQTETGVSRTVQSGADGVYILSNLPLGPYTLEVTKDGFSRYQQTGIVLQVNASPTIDIAMKVGAVTEQVNVEANAGLVETQSTSVGSVIENQRILELPLNGRQATDLIVIAGAAVPQGAATSRSMNGGQAISVAGGQSFGVTYMLDGGLHNNPFDNLNLPLPFPDALQEFKLETGSLTAQNGMHSAAAVNAVTKSGTNDLHFTAFEFLRNGVVNGHPYFSPRADNLKRNQYGGTIGSSLIKNKLFAFGGYQGTNTRSLNPDGQSFVPTQQMLNNGDFSGCVSNLKVPAGFVNPAVGIAPTLIGPNQINPASFSPAAKAIVAKLYQNPASTPTNSCGLVLFGIAQSINEWQTTGRVDYVRNEKHTLFGRYMATTYYQAVPYQVDPNLLNTTQGGRDNFAQSFTLGDTYLFTPATVNQFRIAINRTAIARTNGDFFSAPDVGVSAYSYMPHYMLLSNPSGFSLGGGTESLATFRTTTYQMSDDITIVKGSHQLAFGATINQWRSNGYANVRSPGTYSFSGTATGYGLADFLIGALNNPTQSFVQSAPNTLIARDWYFGAYAQDTWKMNTRLTLNYGLRWEPWFPQQLTNNAIYNFDLSRFYAGTKSVVFKNAPAGFTFPGDAGFPSQAGMNKRWDQFGPRVGLAWDPKGDGKMSIRASYGMSFDFVNGQFFINTANAPPWGSEVRLLGNVPFDRPFSGSNSNANIFPVTFDQNAVFSPAGPFIALKPDTKNTTVHAWTLSLQRQIGTAWLVSASYIGNQTAHLWVSSQLNPCVPGGAAAGCTQARRYLTLHDNAAGDSKYIGFLDQFDDGGTQSYHGLLLSTQRRLAKGVSGSVNYTWSHCVGDFTQGGSTPNVGSGLLDPNNRRLDRGNCVSDRRHIFNLTAVAETPRFSNTTLRVIGTGWRISGLYRFATGAPLTATTSTDVAQSGVSGQRLNLVTSDPYCADRTNACYFNTAAFQPVAQMTLGQLGNLGRFSLWGPGTWQFDMALSRVFKVHEKMSMEVRGEAFNLTNSLRAGNPGTSINTASQFGKIVSTVSNAPGATFSVNDSRVMQFALKLTY
jgi:hypothetical protein